MIIQYVNRHLIICSVSEISLDPVSAVRSCPLSSLKKKQVMMPCYKCYIYANFVDLTPVLANTISENTVPDKIQCIHISSQINLSWLATKKL